MVFTTSSIVKCKNETTSSDKLLRFIEAGTKNLQVIADFDFTMTTYDTSGTCFGAIRTYPGFGVEFLTKTNAIKNKHYPIHVDHTLSEEVRRKSDFQWFTKIMACFVEQQFPRSMLKDMLQKSTCRLRAGVVEFLQLAHQHEIPVLIFSGGIRDIIDVLLEREGCNFDNISIISNRLKFSADDVMVGAEEPYITASSKLEVAKQNVYFSQVKRDNVLLGDMLSDLKMSSCAEYAELVSVAFCNQPAKDEDTYLEHFDVILLENQGFRVINQMLGDIVAHRAELSSSKYQT